MNRMIEGEHGEWLTRPVEVGRPEVTDDETLEAQSFRKAIPRAKRMVFVLGHPRSGTSATCQLVETAEGVQWLADLGSNNHNVYGYYEYRPALQLSTQWVQSPPGEFHPDKASTVMTTINKLKGTIGLKLIHMMSWWYWRWLVEEPKLVCVFRHPADVQRSQMRQRLHNFGPSWMDQNNWLISIFEEEKENAVLVNHERLLRDPSQVAALIESELGYEVDSSVIDTDQHTVQESQMVMDRRELEIYETLEEMERAQYE